MDDKWVAHIQLKFNSTGNERPKRPSLFAIVLTVLVTTMKELILLDLRDPDRRDVGPLTFPFEWRGTRRTQHSTRSSVVIKTRTLLLRARFDAIHTNARTIKLSATRLYK